MGHNPEGGSLELDPLEAARIRALGFDKPRPDVVLTDQDRVLIQSVLEGRMGEYFRTQGDGYRLSTRDLAGVVADIVSAAVRGDRRRSALSDRDRCEIAADTLAERTADAATWLEENHQ